MANNTEFTVSAIYMPQNAILNEKHLDTIISNFDWFMVVYDFNCKYS